MSRQYVAGDGSYIFLLHKLHESLSSNFGRKNQHILILKVSINVAKMKIKTTWAAFLQLEIFLRLVLTS